MCPEWSNGHGYLIPEGKGVAYRRGRTRGGPIRGSGWVVSVVKAVPVFPGHRGQTLSIKAEEIKPHFVSFSSKPLNCTRNISNALRMQPWIVVGVEKGVAGAALSILAKESVENWWWHGGAVGLVWGLLH